MTTAPARREGTALPSECLGSPWQSAERVRSSVMFGKFSGFETLIYSNLVLDDIDLEGLDIDLDDLDVDAFDIDLDDLDVEWPPEQGENA